jgi:hypothetical protein
VDSTRILWTARAADAIPDWGTALIIASTMGKTNVVQVLLDKGADQRPR